MLELCYSFEAFVYEAFHLHVLPNFCRYYGCPAQQRTLGVQFFSDLKQRNLKAKKKAEREKNKAEDKAKRDSEKQKDLEAKQRQVSSQCGVAIDLPCHVEHVTTAIDSVMPIECRTAVADCKG